MAHAINVFFFNYVHSSGTSVSSSCSRLLYASRLLASLVALPTELLAHAISVFFFAYVHSSGISASSSCSRLLYASRLLASLVALPTELPPMLQELLRKTKNGWAARIRT